MLLAAIAALSLAVQPAEEPAELTPIDVAVAALGSGQTTGAEFEAAREAILAEAQAGDPEAMNMAGVLVQNGLAETSRSSEEWYRAAMDAGDADVVASATVNLALSLYSNPERAPEARALLEGFEEGSIEAVSAMQQGFLGFDYLFGIGGEVNQELGRALINGAIVRGFENAYVFESYAAFWLNPPEGVEPRPDRADELYRRAIQAGSVDAAWRLGMLILQSGGMPTEAYRFVEWASDSGHTNAMHSRAVMLATGEGVAQNPSEARVWYLNAAKSGHAHALRALGMMWVTGEGGESDAALGFAMLDMAADAGDAGVEATVDLLEGEGHSRPSDRAVRRAGEAFMRAEGINPGMLQ